MKRHELSALFPEIEGEQFEELVADIKSNGLLHPITIYEGQVLDGWNRWRACKQAGVKPRTRPLPDDADPITFVISENVKRRHLDASQRALVAVDLEKIFAKQAAERAEEGRRKGAETTKRLAGNVTAKPPQTISRAKDVLEKRRKEEGEAREQAAKLLNVSGKMVTDAKVIKEKAPEIAAKIMRGDREENNRKPTVSGAAKQIRLEEDKVRQHALEKQKLEERMAAPLVSLMRDAIKAGTEFSTCIAHYRRKMAEHSNSGIIPRSNDLLKVFTEYQQMLRSMKTELEREYAEVLKVSL